MSLPNHKPPTNHPGVETHPRENVFEIMPVSNIANTVLEGSIAPINLATYTDPFASMDFHRLIRSKPRWVQGVHIEFEEVEPIAKTVGFNSGWHPGHNGVKPADMVFSGKIVTRDSNTLVVGVAHPKIPGWISIEDVEQGEASGVKTIADLKAGIGQISAEEAERQNERRRHIGLFDVNGVDFS